MFGEHRPDLVTAGDGRGVGSKMDGADNLVAWLGHSLSFAALVGALAGLVTPFAALATGAWFLLQLYESRTVRMFLRHRRERRVTRLRMRLAKLLYEETQDATDRIIHKDEHDDR